MTNPFAHADRILSLTEGYIVMNCEPVKGINRYDGGVLAYSPGYWFRVKSTSQDALVCSDWANRTVTFDREAIDALDAPPPQKSPTT